MIDRPRRAACLLALLALASPVLAGAPPASAAATAALSAERFRKPGPEAGVHVWWHWLDGAITREGHHEGPRDDEGAGRRAGDDPERRSLRRPRLRRAARAVRLGRVVLDVPLGARRGAPARDPDRRPQLRRLEQLGRAVDHARAVDEAVRLDEDAGLRRPRRRSRPARPRRTSRGFYRDVAVVAYRTPQQPSAYRLASPRLQANGVEEDPAKLVDGCPISGLRVKRGDRLVLSAPSPLDFDRVAIHLRRSFMWGDPDRFTTRLGVETSADGRRYTPARGARRPAPQPHGDPGAAARERGVRAADRARDEQRRRLDPGRARGARAAEARRVARLRAVDPRHRGEDERGESGATTRSTRPDRTPRRRWRRRTSWSSATAWTRPAACAGRRRPARGRSCASATRRPARGTARRRARAPASRPTSWTRPRSSTTSAASRRGSSRRPASWPGTRCASCWSTAGRPASRTGPRHSPPSSRSGAATACCRGCRRSPARRSARRASPRPCCSTSARRSPT